MRYYASTRVAIMWEISATSEKAVWNKLIKLFFTPKHKLQEMGIDVIEDKLYG